jgi:predicted transcriptional regulator
MTNQKALEIKETFNVNGTLEETEIQELFEIIENLEIQLNSRKKGRKQEVYDVLKNEGPLSISAIAKRLNISTKNVSSQLTYLKAENVKIFTDDNGKKFIHE